MPASDVAQPEWPSPEAWASMKSLKPKDGSDEPPVDGDGRNREADFHGEKRSNDTHASTRKGPGKEAKLCFMGHALMENRNGLVVDACLTPADGHAERIAALHMIEPHADRPQAITLGADKAPPHRRRSRVLGLEPTGRLIDFDYGCFAFARIARRRSRLSTGHTASRS
jgi:hypothetical protein